MRNILTRTITGLVYILLILGSIFYSPLFFIILGLALNIIALWEFMRMIKNIDISPDRTSIFVFGILIYLASIYCVWFDVVADFTPVFIVSALYFPILEMYRKKAKPIENIGASYLALIYITLPLIVLNILNLETGTFGFSYIVLAMFILIWVNDTFAFLTGLFLGRHKLFERISPKKTWEGFFGGMLFTAVISYVFSLFFKDLNLIQWLVFGLLISFSSVFGDFVESFYKRHVNLKDSGSILPGHGGILDRIDSLIFSAPIIFLYLNIIL